MPKRWPSEDETEPSPQTKLGIFARTAAKVYSNGYGRAEELR